VNRYSCELLASTDVMKVLWLQHEFSCSTDGAGVEERRCQAFVGGDSRNGGWGMKYVRIKHSFFVIFSAHLTDSPRNTRRTTKSHLFSRYRCMASILWIACSRMCFPSVHSPGNIEHLYADPNTLPFLYFLCVIFLFFSASG
jgi:hypothetical protein